jgi:hypothetical protein
MESMAEPGTVLISENTHRIVKEFFEFKAMGKLQIKGKTEPIGAYLLLKATEFETRIDAAVAKGLTKFVGRNEEIESLFRAYEKARSGLGQIIGIVGEAGVGKSRLKIELKGLLPHDEFRYLEGRCLHFGKSMAYLPILDILRSYFEIEEGDKEEVTELVRKRSNALILFC